jgi:hypothetical protein
MNIERSIILTSVASLVLCGCNSSTPEKPQGFDLNGTWSQVVVDENSNEILANEVVIQDFGTEIVRIFCRRDHLENLVEDGELLRYKDSGLLHYLTIKSNEELVGFGDRGTASRHVKTFDRAWFDSGVLSLTLDGYPSLEIDYDVCAQNRAARFVVGGEDYLLRKIVYSAPYENGHIEIEFNVRELSVGNYVVPEGQSYELLVSEGSRYFVGELISEEFEAEMGRDRLGIATGLITVNKIDGNYAEITGDITLNDGRRASFSTRSTFVPYHN